MNMTRPSSQIFASHFQVDDQRSKMKLVSCDDRPATMGAMSRSALARGGLLALVTLAEITCSSSGGNGTPSDLGPAAKAKLNEYCAQRTAYTAECLPSAGPCRRARAWPLWRRRRR